MAHVTYNAYKKNQLNGVVDLDTDTIMVALVTDSYTPDIDTHEFFDDITDEVVGAGYTADGKEITGKAVTQDNTLDAGKFDGNDVEWTAATITARAAIIWKTTGNDATSPLIRYHDFGVNKSTVGTTFKITWHVNGILHDVDP